MRRFFTSQSSAIALFLGLALPTSSYGQCNVTKEDLDEEKISFVAGNEQLFQNKDLEDGLQTVYAQFAFVVNKQNKNQMKFFLTIVYVGTKYKPSIVPRQLTFYPTNGQRILSTAESNDSPILAGMRAERCTLRLVHLKLKPLEQYLSQPSRLLTPELVRHWI